MPPRKKQTHHFPAFLSLFIPGLGQLIKGQLIKAISIWLAFAIILFLPMVGMYVTFGYTFSWYNFPRTIMNRGWLFLILLILWGLSIVSFWMYNLYDAYNKPN